MEKEMNVITVRATYMVVTFCLFCASVHADTAQSETSRVVKAANAFLATLDQKQQASVAFAFNDEKQRARWSNLPTGAVPRAGLRLGDLSETQRSAAMALVSSALSERG